MAEGECVKRTCAYMALCEHARGNAPASQANWGGPYEGRGEEGGVEGGAHKALASSRNEGGRRGD